MKNKNLIHNSPSANNEPFGLHLTVDGYGGSYDKLNDMRHCFAFLDKLPAHLQMHKIITPYVIDAPATTPKDQGGISGFVMIAESHISIHTFPDKGFITADVYSCRPFDTEKTIAFFKKSFDLQEVEAQIIKRGLQFWDYLTVERKKKKTSTVSIASPLTASA